MHTPEPLYIEQSELEGMQLGRQTPLDLCVICDKLVPDQILGVQLFNKVWSVWCKTDKARAHLIDSVKTIKFHNREIELHGKYPTHKPMPNEKIVFRDVPINVRDGDILDYLHQQPGIVVKSAVIQGRIRDSNNKLTRFLSGERIVYVKGKFSPVLPSIGKLASCKCRVWHKTQEEACLRCRKLDHHTHDTDKCDAYIRDDDIVTIRSDKYPLCNFYPCSVRVYNQDFASSEHAYQWRFLTYINMPDLAQEVLCVPSAAEAKAVAQRVPPHLHRDWHSIKSSVMRAILHAKADCCAQFKQALLDSGDRRIVEAVRGDTYWSSGLTPIFAASTKPEYYPGSNQLGSILESVRIDLMKEALLFDTMFDERIQDIPLIPVRPVPSTTHHMHASSLLDPLPVENCSVNGDGDENTKAEDNISTTTSVVSDQGSNDPTLPVSTTTEVPLPPLTVSVIHPTTPDSVKKSMKVSRRKAFPKITSTERQLKQVSIVSAFDKFKRKLSEEKEADTTQDCNKISRNDDDDS